MYTVLSPPWPIV